MILSCIGLALVLFILYKIYMGEPLPFLNNIETFVPLRGVSAWDGRGTDYKKCLNEIEGVRHFYYRDASNVCNMNDPFNKYL
jgi:hypothetical protein